MRRQSINNQAKVLEKLKNYDIYRNIEMYRVLIADADPVRACHLEADLSDFGIKAISVVSGEMAIAFCREYDLDLILLDLDMADARDAVRLLRECEATAGIPIMGISRGGDGSEGDGAEWEGLCGVLDGSLKSLKLAQGLRECLQGGEGAEGQMKLETGAGTVDSTNPAGRLYKNPLAVLLDLSERILAVAGELKGSASEFGQDGPEMLGFVEKSADQMHKRLVEIASDEPEQQENRLRDREVRHDFRNILASVRGFTDLILMEEGIAENLVIGLKEIRDCSNQFVEWLDAEKMAALKSRV